MEGRTREKKFWGANQNCFGARSSPAGLTKVDWEVWMCTLPLCTLFPPVSSERPDSSIRTRTGPFSSQDEERLPASWTTP